MKKVVEIDVCDVCGKKEDGEYWRTTHLNGEVHLEYYCPHELCEKHMEDWQHLCEEQSYERYNRNPSKERRAKMLNEFIELLEVQNEI